MALKRNRKIILCLVCFFRLIVIFGQSDTIEDSVVYESAPGYDYDPHYHFDDSAQDKYNSSESDSEFNRLYWEALVRNMSFEEDKLKPRDSVVKREIKPKEKHAGGVFPLMKYVWVILAILILSFVVYKLLPAFKSKNVKNINNLIISLDDLDEEQIKAIEIETPLNEALKIEDYRMAYRLRYLSVLKMLISKNLILYKREKTNYEYLLQLSGLNIYDTFRLLTFNFDGIWYGELFIDKKKYESLDEHFMNFKREIEL